MIRFGAKLAPGGAAEGIGYQTGTWVLGITSSIANVGAWSRGWGLAQRLTDPSVRIVEMLFPTLIERRAGDDRAGFIRAVADSARLSAAALLLPGAVGGGAAVGVMELFGPGFSRAAEALAFLLLIPALHAVSNVQGAALAAGDRPLVSSVVTVGRTVVLVIAGIALSAWIGITGMALAMLLAYVIEVVWFALLVRSTFGSPGRILWPYRSFVAMVLAYGGGFAVARLLDGALSGVLGLGAGLVGGSIAYAAIFLLAGGLTAQDRTHVAALRRRLRARRVGPPVAPEGA
jgi:O-antigen/teichoic acid export membrane protein